MAVLTQIRAIIEGVSELVGQHVRLAKLELKEDARFIGLRIGLIAALAPLLLVGYGFLCVAVALALRRVMADDLAFLLVGAVNLLGGLLGIAVVVRQLQGRQVLSASLSQLRTTSTAVLKVEPKS
jgi:hypothetical protein